MTSSRRPTVTICIPSTAISRTNCRTPQQIAHAAHQIARAACLYGVAEIVVYNVRQSIHSDQETEGLVNGESEDQNRPKKITFNDDIDQDSKPSGSKNSSSDNSESADLPDSIKLATLLQYFITPSYLRNAIFGSLTDSLKYAKRLPKIPGLPFLTHGVKTKYLEGLSVAMKVSKTNKSKKPSKRQKKNKKSAGSEGSAETIYVNIGGEQLLQLEGQKIPVDARVTVDLDKKVVVSARQAYGLDDRPGTWKTLAYGFSVRVADKFSKVFTESPYEGGYDYTLWVPSAEFINTEGQSSKSEEIAETSETKVRTGLNSLLSQNASSGKEINAIIVFGKWKEITQAVEDDKEELQGAEPQQLFDGRLSVNKGSRIEDAVLIALSKLD